MPANTSYKPCSLIKLVVLIATLFITACQTVDTNKNLSTNVISVDNFPVLEVIGVFGENDGDSVSLISLDHKMRYTTIISIANLGDNYVNLKVGDRVQIAGEYAESYPVRIFAKKVMKIANPDKEKCESNNSKNTGSNVWKPQGKAQIPACISTYTDAGKACTSSNECEGRCMVTNQSGRGSCASSSSRFGCGSSIEDFKKHGGILCID